MSRPGIETQGMGRTGRMGRAIAMGLPLLLGLNLGIVAAGPGFAASKSDAAFQPLVAALQVHSSWSTGSLTLDQLAERAKGLGLDGQTNAVFYPVAVDGRGEILSHLIFVGTDAGPSRDMGSRITVESQRWSIQ